MKTTKEFESYLESQVNLKKSKVYEVFVNQNDLQHYWMLPITTPSIMQKVFVPVFGGRIIGISFEFSRALRNLLDAAGCESVNEFNKLMQVA